MLESFEAPGAIVDWAKEKRHEISYSRVYNNEPLPTEEEVNAIDFLVVMGGPQSPASTKEEFPHYDAEAEMDVIKWAIDDEKLVFGACLGAQLIGQALGADFDHSPEREIGYFPLTMTPEAKEDDAFADFPESFLVGHWHGDMPGLTDDAVVLATSEGCPRQIVRYTPKVYGFQCHFEFTPEALEGMIEHCADELEEHKGLPYIEQPDALRKAETREPNKLLYSFLDRFSER